MNVTGNTILITGGATGIGFALAKAFVELGNEVLICGRREHRLQEAKDKIPGLHYKVCDIADAEQREALFKWVKKDFPKLNILVNNGAYQTDYSLTDGLEALNGLEEEIYVILTAPILMNALFTGFLKEKENAAIVNVSSGTGLCPMTRIPAYCAAKAGLHAYTLIQRKQYENAGIDIKVFEAFPPMVITEINLEGRKKAGYANGPAGVDADVYARSVIDDMRNDKYCIVYGEGERGWDAWKLPRTEYEGRNLK